MPSLLVLLVGLLSQAHAATFAGISFPDTVVVGGQTLVFNGAGMREKFTIDLFAGALYLPELTRSDSEALQMPGAKRLVIHFVWREVTRQQQIDAYRENFILMPQTAENARDFETFLGWFEGAKAGDEMICDLVPGVGTTLTIRGQPVGTIPGDSFGQALLGIYLGDHPPTHALKAGLLGSAR